MKNLQKIVDKKKMVESIRYTAKKIKEPKLELLREV